MGATLRLVCRNAPRQDIVTDPAPVAEPVPRELRTARLLLRPWRPDDAEVLAPVLVANQAHLSPWIPRRVWEAAPVEALAERLSGFAAEFSATREWRYAMFTLDDGRVLGEVALFPRAASGRVPLLEADRCEIGYWLREDATGTGLATEAAQAILTAGRIHPVIPARRDPLRRAQRGKRSDPAAAGLRAGVHRGRYRHRSGRAGHAAGMGATARARSFRCRLTRGARTREGRARRGSRLSLRRRAMRAGARRRGQRRCGAAARRGRSWRPRRPPQPPPWRR